MPPDNNSQGDPNPDANFISGVATSLPISDLMGAWCASTVSAQGQAALQTANFIKETAFDESGTIRMVKTDMKVGDLSYQEEVPLLNFLPIPTMQIKESTFGVDMEITTSNAQHDGKQGDIGGALDVQAGWGPVSAKLHVEGKFSSSSERTHKNDASAKVHAKITMGPADVPIGVKRYLDRIQTISDSFTDAVLKGSLKQTPNAPEVPKGPDQIPSNNIE